MSALLLRQPHADDASLRSIHRPAEKVEDAATASTIVLAARFTFIRQFARFASPPSFNPPPPEPYNALTSPGTPQSTLLFLFRRLLLPTPHLGGLSSKASHLRRFFLCCLCGGQGCCRPPQYRCLFFIHRCILC